MDVLEVSKVVIEGNHCQEEVVAANISEEAQLPKFNENSSQTFASAEISKGKEFQLHFDIKKDEIKFEGTERKINSLNRQNSPSPLKGGEPNETAQEENDKIQQNKSAFKFVAYNNSNSNVKPPVASSTQKSIARDVGEIAAVEQEEDEESDDFSSSSGDSGVFSMHTEVETPSDEFNIILADAPSHLNSANISIEFAKVDESWMSAVYRTYENDFWFRLRREDDIWNCYYVCNFCSRKYCTFEFLKGHLNVHLGFFPFKCKICRKSFTLRRLLVAHLRNNHHIERYDYKHYITY
uniref:C2H2-type domain-containing protein n=1 Tax=Glossina austeni TaxID=7395 RepID=A0A1A9UZZ5_GLOAU